MLRFAEPHIYTPVDDSLVLWISGRGRGVGSKIFDLSKKGNHGTIYGAIWVNIPIGHSALSFDGVDDYISVQGDESLDITHEITIEAWVYPRDRAWIVSKDGGDNTRSFMFYETTAGGGTWALQVDRDGDSKYTSIVHSDLLVQKNIWTYFVATYKYVSDGSSIGKIYVNGALDGLRTDMYGPIFSSNEPIFIGRWRTLYFNGITNELRIYNRVLSEEEIRERYNATKHLYGY